MFYTLLWIGALLMYTLAVLMCIQESKKRRIGLLTALLVCILLSPVLGYFIIANRARRDAIGCQWCGNMENEAEYCGICGKNILGESKPA